MDKKEWQAIKDRWASTEYKGHMDFNMADDILVLITEIERLSKVEEEFRGYIPFLAVHGFFETEDIMD